MHLDADTFLSVVRHTPLVAIDLIARDPAGAVLVGRRANRPARDWWFVPGGRIYKGERLTEAFARITRDELGASVPFDQARLLGVYEHLYDDNFAGVEGFGTHYVVLGYTLALDHIPAALPRTQHRDYLWLTPDAMRARGDVHPNTLAYFPAR